MISLTSREGAKRVIINRRVMLENLASLSVSEQRVYGRLSKDLYSVKKVVPREDFLVLDGRTGYSSVLKKAGTALVLSSPIPIVSDVLGAGLLALGILSEYRRRRRLRYLLNDYSYEIVNGFML